MTSFKLFVAFLTLEVLSILLFIATIWLGCYIDNWDRWGSAVLWTAIGFALLFAIFGQLTHDTYKLLQERKR